jgi:ATP-dependent Clp protease ATP-binding subunit ClpX
MRALLFRRIEFEGVNYYQLFDYDSEFIPDDGYGDYLDRDVFDCFYIDSESDIEVPDESLMNIYCDDNGKLKVVDDPDLYDKVSREFNKRYHYFLGERKTADDIITNISKTIMFQKPTVIGLVHQICNNQDIVNSDLPQELKRKQKNNILFHGKVGSGKKTIINELEKQLDIPYADIYINPDVKDTLEKIIQQLIEKTDNDEEASHGIVFIRDNYDDLVEVVGEDTFDYLNFLTSQGIIEYEDRTIDFRTVTFVILKDETEFTTPEEIQAFTRIANCACRIGTKDLSNTDKYLILYSPNGRLYQYNKFLESKGKKLIIDTKSLIDIIKECNKVDPNMNTLNMVIDAVVKKNLSLGIDNIYIDNEAATEVIERFLPALSGQPKERASNNIFDEEFWFEQKVDEIVNEVKKYVVGQDRAVRLMVHQLVKNIRWANKEDIDNPKEYIKNILIRGNPGTGKTFITGTILKYLGVPYYIADATEYTEAGYVGKDVEDMLVDLYHAAGDDLEKAERGVLVIDEVDKRASKGGGGRDVSGSGVQEALYKFAEGTVIRINIGNRMNEIPVYFDTSRLTIICSGAFEGIEAIRDERVGRKKVGFGNQEVKKEDAVISDVDYISYGMKSQFMRRVKQVIELKNVSKEQFIDIMKNSKSSSLKVEQDTLRDQGIEVEYTEDFYSALADKALQMKQGVTGIEKALLNVFQSINIQDIRPSKIQKIILSADVINDPSKVVLIEREKVKSIGTK